MKVSRWPVTGAQARWVLKGRGACARATLPGHLSGLFADLGRSHSCPGRRVGVKGVRDARSEGPGGSAQLPGPALPGGSAGAAYPPRAREPARVGGPAAEEVRGGERGDGGGEIGGGKGGDERGRGKGSGEGEGQKGKEGRGRGRERRGKVKRERGRRRGKEVVVRGGEEGEEVVREG